MPLTARAVLFAASLGAVAFAISVVGAPPSANAADDERGGTPQPPRIIVAECVESEDRGAEPLAKGTTPKADYHRAVCQVVQWRGNTGAGGSAVLVAVDSDRRRGLVLTNAHVVGDQAGQIIVTFDPDSESESKTSGRLLGVDQQLDLAAIEIDAPPGVAPLAVAEEEPEAGERVEVCCYSGGRFHHFACKVKGTSDDGEDLCVAAHVVSGNSGGPILNERRQVAAILWGGPLDPELLARGRTRMIHTQGARCQRIRGFLDRLGERTPFRGDSGVCPSPGRCPRPRPWIEDSPDFDDEPGDSSSNPLKGDPSEISDDDRSAPANSSLSQRIAALEREIRESRNSAAGRVGPRGPAGPRGAPGPAGASGPSADSAALADLANRIERLEERSLSERELERIADHVKKSVSGSIRVRVEPMKANTRREEDRSIEQDAPRE